MVIASVGTLKIPSSFHGSFLCLCAYPRLDIVSYWGEGCIGRRSGMGGKWEMACNFSSLFFLSFSLLSSVPTEFDLFSLQFIYLHVYLHAD